MEPVEWNLDRDEEFRSKAALTALRLFSMGDKEVEMLKQGEYPQHALVAEFCYGVADAMVAERRRRMRGGTR